MRVLLVVLEMTNTANKCGLFAGHVLPFSYLIFFDERALITSSILSLCVYVICEE